MNRLRNIIHLSIAGNSQRMSNKNCKFHASPVYYSKLSKSFETLNCSENLILCLLVKMLVVICTSQLI
jgi:hypothetical protein